jgi:sphingosine kinase
MASTTTEDNPFKDPKLVSNNSPQPSSSTDNVQAHAEAPDTLPVGRNASLTLGTDALIVQGSYQLIIFLGTADI